MTGLLVFNKPMGMRSRDVVDVVEKWFPGERAGHAGTLDPMATGVLVICLGPATRLIEHVQDMPKTYRASIRLGATSDTDDAEGKIEPVPHARVPLVEEVRDLLDRFVGEIAQVPPAYSAVRLNGRRAYQLARKGKPVELIPRKVRIDRIQLDRYDFPRLEITVDCGKGTYIRSLARDLGQALGTGSYLEALERTRIGPFWIGNALEMDAGAELARARLLPLRAAVTDLPAVTLSDELLWRLRNGQRLRLENLEGLPGKEIGMAVLTPAGELAAVARWRPEEHTLAPEKVFQSGIGKNTNIMTQPHPRSETPGPR